MNRFYKTWYKIHATFSHYDVTYLDQGATQRVLRVKKYEMLVEAKWVCNGELQPGKEKYVDIFCV